MTVEAGFNVYGHFTSGVGLGIAARQTVTMLRTRKREVNAIEVGLDGKTRGIYDPSRDTVVEGLPAKRLDINIFHTNPDRLHHMLCHPELDLGLHECLNTCVPFWEAPRLPRYWLPSLMTMDAILAPSRFVHQAIAADLPQVDVLDLYQAVYLPCGVHPNRQRWGIPEGRVAFVTSFALASSIERKNPWAILEAFQRAFPTEGKAALVVKVSHPVVPALVHHDMNVLLGGGCGRRDVVVLIEEPLSYPEVLSLYDSCDVLVSLHRSEGLGLSLLEAMSLGKPVIGTGWSGNMDFMTPEDSAVIPYRLVDIDVPLWSPYHSRSLGGAAQWAEPDVDAAAEWMVRLAESAELRRSMGAAAKRRAEMTRSRFEAGEALDALDTALAGFRARGHRPHQVAALKRLRRSYYTDPVKRLAKTYCRRIIALRVRMARPANPAAETTSSPTADT